MAEFKPWGNTLKTEEELRRKQEKMLDARDAGQPERIRKQREEYGLTERDWLDRPSELGPFEFLGSFYLYAYGYIP